MINVINHPITIDLANKMNMIPNYQIKKNDNNSHKFVFTILNNSLAYDLTGQTARIYFQKSDTNKVFLDCTIDDAVNGKLSSLLSTQCLSYAGVVATEIPIYGTNGEILTSITFNFTVTNTIRDDAAIQSSSEFTALTNALVTVNNIVSEVQTARGTYPNLGARLDNSDTQLNDITTNKLPLKANQSDLNTTNNNVAANTSNISNNTNAINTHSSQIASLASGAPKAVSLVSQMTDTTKNYVYTGSEGGYTAGNWYYYNGSVWTSGGVYQGIGIAANAVTQNELADMSIITKLFKQGKNTNIYNNAMIMASGYVGMNGSLVTPNSGFVFSDKIYLIANTTYTIVADWQTIGEQYKLHFYKADDTHISYATGTTTTGATFTTPTGTSYCRVSFLSTSNYNNTMIVYGSVVPPSYISYGAYFDFLKLSDSMWAQIVKTADLSYGSATRNLFDKTKITTGYEVYSDGTFRVEANSAITDYIPVSGSNLYVSGLTAYATGLQRYCYFYDANKNPIGTVSYIAINLSEAYITIPLNAVYFRMSIYQRKTSSETINLDTIQIELNNIKTSYVSYVKAIYTIQGLKALSISTLKTKDKNLLLFGDSVTETATVSDDGVTYTEGTRQNWPTFSRNNLQIGQMWNYAKSGAHYCDNVALLPRQQISTQITTAIANSRPGDIIVIACGTNDGVATGDYNTAMSKATLNDLDRTNSLYEALRWAFWTIRQNYPNAVCFASTPLQRADREPVTALSSAIKQMANRYNFIVVDAEYESGIVKDFEVWNANGRYLYDGLHPSTNGQILMSKMFNRAILNNLNDAN